MTTRKDGLPDPTGNAADTKDSLPPGSPEELRRRAEEKAGNESYPELAALSPDIARRLFHDLRVHQIELEMQNEELRRTQDALEASRARYFDLYDLAPVGYLTISEHGLILESNLSAANLLGVNRNALCKERFARFIVPEEQDVYYLHCKRLFASGDPQVYELRLQRQDGVQFYSQVNAVLARDEESGASVGRITINDVTGQKRAEAALRESEERAAFKEQLYHDQKLEFVGKLAGGVAHNFNNVLMAITGYAHLIQMELRGNEPISGYVQKIIESSGKAVNLTQSLLSFSRRQPIALAPVNMNEIIKNLEPLLIQFLGETIECKILLSGKDLSIMADSGRIEQIVMNLVTNARDVMPQGGCLTVRTEMVELDGSRARELQLARAGRYTLLSISDTGIGMDEETKKRIFEPFFTTKERGKGTGIGLAMVYGTVRQHGGHIEVTSRPNQGTTFDVYLPVMEAAENRIIRNGAKTAADAAKAPEAASASPRTAKTILVAEDEAEVRDVVVAILKHAGYGVISSANGKDAVVKFQGHAGDVDLLLFDVMMPGMNGKEAYNEIQKIKPGVRAIFMSGYSEDTATNRAIQEEGLLFLQKPVITHKLLDTIRGALAR